MVKLSALHSFKRISSRFVTISDCHQPNGFSKWSTYARSWGGVQGMSSNVRDTTKVCPRRYLLVQPDNILGSAEQKKLKPLVRAEAWAGSVKLLFLPPVLHQANLMEVVRPDDNFLDEQAMAGQARIFGGSPSIYRGISWTQIEFRARDFSVLEKSQKQVGCVLCTFVCSSGEGLSEEFGAFLVS